MKKLMLWVAFFGFAASSVIAHASAPVAPPGKPTQISKPEMAPKPPAKPQAEKAKPENAPKAVKNPSHVAQPTAMAPQKPASMQKGKKPAEVHQHPKAPQTQPPVVK